MEPVFYRPASLAEAVDLLARYGTDALVVNGGTDAVPALTERKTSPRAVIYIGDLPELRGIAQEPGILRIGGGVTYAALCADPRTNAIRGLREAVSHLASPPIRAIATPAGNLCTAAPSADCATMLLALRADVHLLSQSGARTVPLDQFQTGTRRTARRGDELLTSITIPAPGPGDGTGYCRLSRRKAQDIGKVLVGVSLHLEGGAITRVSIGLGALNACARRAVQMEQALAGMDRAQALAFAAATFPREAELRESYFKAYKQSVTCEAVARALEMAFADAEEGQ